MVSLQGGYAVIATQRKSACGSCNASGACGTSLIGSLFPERSSQMLVNNDVQAGIGDRVVVGMDESQVQKASLLLYAVPLIGLIVGALVGQEASIMAGFMQQAELVSVVMGLLGLGGGLMLVSTYSERRAGLLRDQTRILRVERVAIPVNQLNVKGTSS